MSINITDKIEKDYFVVVISSRALIKCKWPILIEQSEKGQKQNLIFPLMLIICFSIAINRIEQKIEKAPRIHDP